MADYIADNKQAALNAIDPKGNIVLKEFGGTALLFRPASPYEPYVVADGYDKASGDWSSGSYFSDPGKAWEKADPEIIEKACIRWERDDIKAALENEGYPATEANISWMSGNITMQGFYSGLVSEGNERLGWLVQDEDRYLDQKDSEPKNALEAARDTAQDASNRLCEANRNSDAPGIDPR